MMHCAHKYHVHILSCFSLSKEGRVIVMSIHQPRYSIFRLFDHITLMSQGNVIYAGAGRATLPYFSEVLGNNYYNNCLYACVSLYVYMCHPYC